MSPQMLARSTRRALMHQLRPERRRGWLTHGLAALAVSALGLGAAGALSLTSSAESVGSVAAQTQVTSGSTKLTTSVQPRTPLNGSVQNGSTQNSTPSALTDGSLSSFSRRAAAADQATRSALREAQVKEKTAARAEDLSKASERISRAARDAVSAERSKGLQSTQKATQDNAVRIAEEARRRAEAARVAAEAARVAAETESRAAEATATTSTPAPSSEPSEPAVQTTTKAPPATGNGRATMPIASGYRIAATFGQVGSWSRYHTGLDLSAPVGTSIHAPAGGEVTNAGSGSASGWAGTYVAIRHADGKSTLYAHMSSVSVSVGQTVAAGQVVGAVGMTGRTFGPHCHFEVYPAGVTPGDVYRAINPQPWLASLGL